MSHVPNDPKAVSNPVRSGEYAARGEYHRAPDPAWDYLPTYRAKLAYVRGYLAGLPPTTRVLDAGCGEGVLVEEFADRVSIIGLDEHYTSPHVRQGSLLALPWPDGSFDRVLCLDVLEHLSWADQPRAIAELARVTADTGELLVSVPNLAHLQSRVHFLLTGRLIRTASEAKHPGDRPIGEYLRLFDRAGLRVVSRHGIFPTIPVLTSWIRRHPTRLAWLHRALTFSLRVPGLAFLNVVVLRKEGRQSGPADRGPADQGPAKAGHYVRSRTMRSRTDA